MRSVLMAGAVVFAVTDASAGELKYAGTLSGKVSVSKTDKVWVDPMDGTATKVVWKDGSTVVLPSGLTGSLQMQQWFSQNCAGIRHEGTGKVLYYTSEMFSTGAEGVTFIQPGCLAYGYYGFASPTSTKFIYQLTADQIWDGRNTSGTATIAIGTEGAYNRTYALSPICASDNVRNLTIKGRLAAFFYSKRNSLPNVAVRVESPAELVLGKCAGVCGTNVDPTEGMLHAKSVTFAGDGVRARFGCKSVVAEKYQNSYPMTVAALDAEHLGETVTLADGADLIVSNAVFGLEKLTVTGGESVIGGSKLTFANETTELEIGAGATLTLDVVPAAVGKQAAFAVTGDGTLILAKGAGGITKKIDVAAGATLQLTSDKAIYTPVTGAGSLKAVLEPADELYVGDLTGFTGPVTVSGGTLVLTTPPVGGVTETDGGKVVYTPSQFVVTDVPVENTVITVNAGETLYVGGDGLKASSTVKMHGGTLCVMRDSVISASIEQDVTSVYSIDSTNITATFAGPWTVRSADYKSTTRNAALLYGGDFQVTGGVRTWTEIDDFFIYEGSIRFSEKEGWFDGNFGADSTCGAVTRWEISGVTYEACFRTSNHPGQSKPTSGLGFFYCPSSDSTFAVVDGGKFWITTSRRFYCSGRNGGRLTMLVDGGSVSVQNSWGDTSLAGSSPYDPVTIDFRAGEIEIMRPFGVNSSGSAVLKWTGGTIRPVFDGTRRLGNTGYVFSGGNVTFDVLGTDCQFNLAGVPSGSAVTNAQKVAALNVSSGGRITANGPGTLYLAGYTPNGTSLQLNENARIVVPAVNSGSAFDEIAVNGTNCTLAAVSVTGAPSVRAVRIGPSGSWPTAALAGIGNPGFTDMTFDDGAMCRLNQEAEVMELPGQLSFGGTVRYLVERPAGSVRRAFTAVRALGGIVGEPKWERLAGSRYLPTIIGNDIVFDVRGLVMVVQ